MSTSDIQAYTSGDLTATWMRPIAPLVDLYEDEAAVCEHPSGCERQAVVVAGGRIGQAEHGWLLCLDHARQFSQKTQTRIPRGIRSKV